MKTISTLICAAALLSFVVTASAEDKKATTQPAQPKKSAANSESAYTRRTSDTVLTGSYIPRPVRKDGQITDGPSPLLVIDSEMIKRSGSHDLADLLRRGGYTH